MGDDMMEPPSYNAHIEEFIKALLHPSLTERLAEIEHEQFVEWSKAIAKDFSIPNERLQRWLNLWNTPYENLSEEWKKPDREYARRVLVAVITHIMTRR